MARRDVPTATLVKTLVYYDGPQLVLLKNNFNEFLLGTAIERDGYKYPLLCCQMLPRYLNRYMSGKADLLYVYKQTPAYRIFLADLGIKSESIQLIRLKKEDFDDEDLYPEPGIFSRVHTSSSGSTYDADAYKQRFEIDGTWDAQEFSRFHGRISDVYSLSLIAKRIGRNEAAQSEIAYLRNSISQREWEGGGSYVGFYSDIREDAIPLHSLRVAGIEYHSPGYVDLAGDKSALDDVISSIQRLVVGRKLLATKYAAIRKLLSRDGILRSGKDANFSTRVIEEYVRKQTLELASEIGVPSPEAVLAACDDNTAIFAKIVLSLYRRLGTIAGFFVEGRVNIGVDDVVLRGHSQS